MSEFCLDVFHGTDRKCAEQILNSDFIYRYNNAHWLGNGVYFYMDKFLAQWWTSKPSKSFGSNISDPVIIRCKLNIDEDFIIDLRNYQDYKMFTNIYYNDFINSAFLEKFDINHGNSRKVRCSYCDFLHEKYDCQLIIGNFYLPKQPYLKGSHYEEVSNVFSLPYIETQVCLFNTTHIIKKEIVEVKQ